MKASDPDAPSSRTKPDPTKIHVARGFTIRLKLFVLVGVPLIGALLLAGLIVTTARGNARRAEALGSIEDLGRLSRSMSKLVHELQMERALLSTRLGKLAHAPDADVRGPGSRASLDKQFAATVDARRELDGFLSARDLSRMPPQLDL